MNIKNILFFAVVTGFMGGNTNITYCTRIPDAIFISCRHQKCKLVEIWRNSAIKNHYISKSLDRNIPVIIHNIRNNNFSITMTCGKEWQHKEMTPLEKYSVTSCSLSTHPSDEDFYILKSNDDNELVDCNNYKNFIEEYLIKQQAN